MIPQQYKLFLLVILFCSQIISAQKKTIINVNGNKINNDDFYSNLIQQNFNKSISEIELEIVKALQGKGLYNSNFNIDTNSVSGSTIYNLNISEGEPTFVNEFFIDSVDVQDSLNILTKLNSLVGGIFIEEELELKINELLDYYENNGYPFVRIVIKSLYFFKENESHLVDINLNLTKDERRKIDKVEIIGNSKTNENVIINAARLKKGEIYSQERLDQIPILLKRLNFFKEINEPKYYTNSNDEGILQITIKEKNTNSFDGILGYVPAANNEDKGYLTGFVNIVLRNLFGTGRSTSIKWKQESSLTQELELRYLEPWIFNQPVNVQLNFFQRKQDSSYVRRIIGGNIEYLATENISASLIVESESIIPSLGISNFLFPNSSSINSGLELKLDYRDDIYTPQSGVYFSSLYKFKAKSIKNISENSNTQLNDVNYHYYEFDFGFFYKLFESQIIAVGLHAKAIDGDQFDLSDLFRLGGTNSLRGYRENQFAGNRIIWSNLEYRFLLSSDSYLFTFFDAGYYQIDENKELSINKQSNFKNGYGLGISLNTTLGIMRVSYAFAEGNSISDGLIHFGILNDF